MASPYKVLYGTPPEVESDISKTTINLKMKGAFVSIFFALNLLATAVVAQASPGPSASAFPSPKGPAPASGAVWNNTGNVTGTPTTTVTATATSTNNTRAINFPSPTPSAPSSPVSPPAPAVSPSVPSPASVDSVPQSEAEAIAESPTAPQATDEAVCFPADATVVLASGEVITMENLQVGHRVQVGTNQFSDVVMFTHALPNVKHSFVQLTTASGKNLRATEGHYIYANRELTRMGDVAIGNLLETSSRKNEQVVSITRGTGRGLYNPQTAHGDIIVDGIRASAYTETIPNKAAHAMLAPVRAAFEWTGLQINALEKIVW